MVKKRIEEGFSRKGGIRSKPSTSKPDFEPPPQIIINIDKKD